MIYFSPAKINIGLQILLKRPDGFHDLQSVMFPVNLCDILEIRKSSSGKPVRFHQTGIRFDSDHEKNLCISAWELLAATTTLPPVDIHLHKQIPVGAGLGGGSSNASTTLKGLNTLAVNSLKEKKLEELAARLGSDCPFFLHNGPMMMEGRGEILNNVTLDLDHLFLVLLFPGIPISTSAAYGSVTPRTPEIPLKVMIREPVENWKDLIRNDFEDSLFKLHPVLGRLKTELYRSGAIYASLSGSGSALYGLYSAPPVLSESLKKYVIWKGSAGQITPVRSAGVT